MSARPRLRIQGAQDDEDDCHLASIPEDSNVPTPRGRALTSIQLRPVTVIASLNDAYCYEADDATARFSRDGEILPTKSRRKTFGPGLHRLRDRLRHLDERLQLDINGLKQEVLNLELHKSLLETKIQAQWTRQSDAAVQCVTEYFGAFKHGWLELPEAHTHSERGIVYVESDHERLLNDRRRLLIDRQRHFVSSALHPAMLFGSHSEGIDALVRHWKTCSTYMDGVRLSMMSVDCDNSSGSPVVTAYGLASGVITEQSIRVLFPHLDPAGRLARQLIGSRICSPCTIRCYFDTGTATQILRLTAHVNNIQGLKALLGDLVLVAEALSGSYLATSYG